MEVRQPDRLSPAFAVVSAPVSSKYWPLFARQMHQSGDGQTKAEDCV
jgi:hypothetical protein